MEVIVIDNFLPSTLFENIENSIVFNRNFPLYFQKNVSHDVSLNCDLNQGSLWNWYASHIIYNYNEDSPDSISEWFPNIFETFIPRIKSVQDIDSLLRIKTNFYPHTETLREHGKHVDYDFACRGAIYSLNTCNGFTRFEDGTKIDSVANRMIFFNAGKLHNSSTTTDQMGRYNINFNYL